MRKADTRTDCWWFCDNLIDHKGMVGLLRLDFPRVFILMRDYPTAYFENYEEWKESVEVQFLDPEDKETADVESLLIEAWNFQALSEEADEEMLDELGEED